MCGAHGLKKEKRGKCSRQASKQTGKKIVKNRKQEKDE